MEKTILFGEKGMISRKTSAWLFSILGIVWIVLGSIEVYKEEVSIYSSGYLIIGFVFVLYGLIVFTANPFAPKVTISDSDLRIKKNVFGGSIRILWTSIQSIEFDNYMVAFRLKDRIEAISYGTNAEISIEIKSTIREVAEKKGIQVIGG